ncbi:MAG TPA: hypothetical protein VEB59_09150 [Gemmatimonadales bacterium]|nr:hypothetical protein [Gemmatimonadales bacterium]
MPVRRSRTKASSHPQSMAKKTSKEDQKRNAINRAQEFGAHVDRSFKNSANKEKAGAS